MIRSPPLTHPSRRAVGRSWPEAGLTLSLPLIRPLGFPIYVAAPQLAPFVHVARSPPASLIRSSPTRSPLPRGSPSMSLTPVAPFSVSSARSRPPYIWVFPHHSRNLWLRPPPKIIFSFLNFFIDHRAPTCSHQPFVFNQPEQNFILRFMNRSTRPLSMRPGVAGLRAPSDLRPPTSDF